MKLPHNFKWLGIKMYSQWSYFFYAFQFPNCLKGIPISAQGKALGVYMEKLCGGLKVQISFLGLNCPYWV